MMQMRNTQLICVVAMALSTNLITGSPSIPDFRSLLANADVSLAEKVFDQRFMSEDEDCDPLPPSPPDDDELELELLDLLTCGTEFLQNYTDANNAVLLLGNTGAGKTTVSQIIAGDLSKLHVVLAPGGVPVIIDDDNRIGLPSTKSKTLIPELVLKQPSSPDDTALPFYDCPGFDDTRGHVKDIAANFFMNQVASSVYNIKMVFLVIYSSIKQGNDRMDFDLLTKHATTFVKNIGKFTESFGLLVTKVDNFNSVGRLKQDHIIMEEIVDFLKTYNTTLYSDLESGGDGENENILKKIIFVKTLLQQEPSTGNFTNIWFVRTPMECGPLSNQELILYAKSNITKLYEHLKYTNVDAEKDFGFTLKDQSLLSIANYTTAINEGISEAVNQVTKSLKRHYFEVIILPKVTNLALNELFYEMRNISLQLNTIFEELSYAPSIVIFHDMLEIIWKAMKYSLPIQFKNFLVWENEYLIFFDKVTSKLQDRLAWKWAEPVLKFNVDFINHKDWYEFCLRLESNITSFDFHSRRPVPPTNPNQFGWFDYIVDLNVVTVTDHIQKVYSIMGETELKLLDRLMTFALTTSNIDCSTSQRTLTIQANYITTGEIKKHFENCGNTVSRINIFAAHKIFADQNLTLLNTDLVVLTPIFENPLQQPIVWQLPGSSSIPKVPTPAVSGSNGSSLTNKNGGNGNNGFVGMPGYPGGALLGVINTVTSSIVILFGSKGGDGSDGQRGGNGGNGYSRDMANYENPEKDEWISRLVGCGSSFCSQWVHIQEHGGQNGGNGGKGGDGGRKGQAGQPSKIKTFILQDNFPVDLVQIEEHKGTDGTDGEGGNKGFGATKGQGYKCEDYSCKRYTDANRQDGIDGTYGTEGCSDLNFTNPISPRTVDESSHILQYRMHFLNYSNFNTVNFIHTIDASDALRPLFTLKALAEESLALESFDKSTLNPERLAEMFYLLIGKLEKYSEDNFNGSTKEHKKVISMLLTSSYSSYIRLRNLSTLPVILDVSYYFSIVKQQIENLKTEKTLVAIQNAKAEFQHGITTKITEAVNFIDTTVSTAIRQAKVEIEVLIAAMEQHLVDWIKDATLSLEDCKEELRHMEKRQSFLKIIKVFEVVGDLASSFLPGNWSTIATMVSKLSGQLSGNPNELERLNELVNEIEDLLNDLQEKQEKLDEEFLPVVDSLFKFWRNMSESLSSGGDISAPDLAISKWQVTSKLKDCKYSLEELANSALNTKPLINAFDRIQDAMTLSIELYEMVDRYMEMKSLGEYIAIVNSAELEHEPIKDPELARVVAKFEVTIRQNLLEQEVTNALHAFKQWVFPFAKLYFPQGILLSSKSTAMELGDDQLRQVKDLEFKLEKYKAMIVGDQDTFIIQTNFSSGLKTSKPFFTWKNELWKDHIQSLFLGEKVNFNADVRSQGMTSWEAIKFKLIEINFKLNKVTAEIQLEFDDILEYFGISMTHSGVSYYRFQEDYFVMTGENQTLQYNFEVDGMGNRLGTNQVYEKFRRGDCMLSPYTLWTVELLNMNPVRRLQRGKVLRDDVSYESFKKFLPHIEVELVGIGTYVKGNEALAAAAGNLDLQKWYERDNRLRHEYKF